MSRGAKFAAAYVGAVALAFAYGFAFPGDGDGLSFLPVVILAAPWTLIGALITAAAAGSRSIAIAAIAVGVVANALIAYKIGERTAVRAR